MQHSTSIFRNYLLPSALIAFMVLIMTGCFYVPTLNIARNGFDAPNLPLFLDLQLIKVGRTKRGFVEALLGRPFLYQPGILDEKRVASAEYDFESYQGIWVNLNPLGAGVGPAVNHLDIGYLDYDENDVVTRFTTSSTTKNLGIAGLPTW